PEGSPPATSAGGSLSLERLAVTLAAVAALAGLFRPPLHRRRELAVELAVPVEAPELAAGERPRQAAVRRRFVNLPPLPLAADHFGSPVLAPFQNQFAGRRLRQQQLPMGRAITRPALFV